MNEGLQLSVDPSNIEVEARVFDCGCLTAHTEAGALAEAEYCPGGLSIARELREKRKAHRALEFRDQRFLPAFELLVELEEALEDHRFGKGVLARAWRPHDRRKAVGEHPKPASLTGSFKAKAQAS